MELRPHSAHRRLRPRRARQPKRRSFSARERRPFREARFEQLERRDLLTAITYGWTRSLGSSGFDGALSTDFTSVKQQAFA